ncbi:helicase-related protein [Thermodesulfobacteriota bacterium]
MPTHDIIDNRNEKLVDHINSILASTDSAKFAVGYFFLSGLTSISKNIENVKEMRLLIGNTTNRDTLEQLAEGYRRLEMVADEAEAQAYPKRTESKRMVKETAENIKGAVELMDQTDEGEDLLNILVRMIEEKRLKVRVYTKGRLHAKAYIFDYHDDGRYEKGIAVVGSSNLTLSGVTHNTELNVVVQGNDNHFELSKWFSDLWDEARDFDESLMDEIKQSWAIASVRPYDIYMKTLYMLVKDRLEGGDEHEILWDDEITKRLADFQKVAVHQAVQIIKDYGGAFVSDVVGLGKSYIGSAIVKYFERVEHARPLIICPASLVDMWESYNEVYQLNARVLSIGYLREDKDGSITLLTDNIKYRDRNLILIDESHNFRYPETQKYKLIQNFLAVGRRCCFLTATPRNKSAWDVFHQIKLFHQDDKTDLPIDPPDLRQYFKGIEKGEKKLPDILVNLLIRRTRNHILRWYGYDSKTHQPIDPSRFDEYRGGNKKAYVFVGGKHQFFPKRELETIEYSIEDTYQGLYQQIRGYLGKSRKSMPKVPPKDELTYARYGLWHYVKRGKQKDEPYVSLKRAGFNLRGLIRVLLFKRFESSVYAFRETVRRLLILHERFLEALSNGIVPAGEDAQVILYEPNQSEEQDIVDTLRQVSGRYVIDDFDFDRLTTHITHDIELFKRLIELVEPITPEKDTKLQTLINKFSESPLDQGKRLIFTQYADTARYIYENINPGDKYSDIDVIYSGDKSKARVVGRFSPKSNPEYKRQKGETELNTVVATDVLAEGLNLQDCDKIINYDLHWNPVRLIQRFGRIDRIGSEHDVIYGYNFLPEAGIEKNLRLRQRLKNRIQEIHDTIGEDASILDRSEHLNEDAMYAIYEKKGGQLSLFEDGEEFIDLNEAEEILRQLKNENPGEYDRIANLRDGIRAAKPAKEKNLFVFCQAGRYQQLILLDEKGKEISRDIPRILGMIKCGQDLKGVKLPSDYNKAIMRVKQKFVEEVKHRQSERKHTLSLTLGQRYVLRELRLMFGTADDEGIKGQINILEKAFRSPITTAINRELNLIRRNGVTGNNLMTSLVNIYHQHNMKGWSERRRIQLDDHPIPKVVCSEGLV